MTPLNLPKPLYYLFFLMLPLQAFSIENAQCTACHQLAQDNWQQSDHARSMAIANKSSVLANFDQQAVKHYGQQAVFFIDEGIYKVTLSYGDNTDTYPIKYTFGHYPLQHYLVETDTGRLQVLPFAWDSRPQQEGGQRWYHNYSGEEIRPEDRLHWRQPLQNWNGMCADCHSDGLVRQYDTQQNTFNSHWDNINVGCMSCHTETADHSHNNNSNSNNSDDAQNEKDKKPTADSGNAGQWIRNANQKTAHWQGQQRDNHFMDNCFACHSLRSPLTDGFSAGKAFLDQFTPQLLAAPNYYSDGQIKEEVYVYGSFLQSKMFAAGVNCIDCHDQHSMKVKDKSNGLCLQCHSPEAYNNSSHHHHDDNSAGAECVNCHMPDKTYMGVDDRRDHSFKIPRPDVSVTTGSPNACTHCHQQKTNVWAQQTLTRWHGKATAISQSRQHYWQLHRGQRISLAQHLAIVADEQLDIISRATALQLLANSTDQLNPQQLILYLQHEQALLRLAASSAAILVPLPQRVELLAPLLTDPLKAIRVSAARSLIDAELPKKYMSVFRQAFEAMQIANQTSSWRGEGRLNQGIIEYTMHKLSAAEKSFIAATQIEPFYDETYLSLAELYRAQQRPEQALQSLQQGISRLPNSAALQYAYGLHLVRQQQHRTAVTYFHKAMILAPSVEPYIYTYVLALDGQGQTAKGLSELQRLMPNAESSQQLRELGLYLARKINNRQAYDWFQTR